MAVKIKVQAEREDQNLEEYCRRTGVVGDFKDAVKAMQKKSKRWGWCSVKVTASLPGVPDVEGVDYLGACSYASRQDFIDNSGYYQDMVKTATAELDKELELHLERFQSEVDKINLYFERN